MPEAIGRPASGAVADGPTWLVVADGDVPERARLDAAWPGWAEGISRVAAADRGALGAERIGFQPDLVVGDLDSLPAADLARLRGLGAGIEQAPAEKDESDLELALLTAAARGAARIVVLGAFGGSRLDHAIANLLLLAHPDLIGRPISLLDARARVRLLRAPTADGLAARCELPGTVGGLVSLLPVGGSAEGVATEGLRYELRDESLALGPARGLSNVRTRAEAAVSLRRGLLLVIETAPETGGST
jgi:thiamine pyrophosphokinase